MPLKAKFGHENVEELVTEGKKKCRRFSVAAILCHTYRSRERERTLRLPKADQTGLHTSLSSPEMLVTRQREACVT